jgi:protein phosphatase
VNTLAELRLAPFHILASEGAVHANKTHLWHLEEIQKMCDADVVLNPSAPLLQMSRWKKVNLNDDESVRDAIAWWLDLTERGGEGMVVKPMNFVEQTSRGLIQPAIKCRGKEYLRIIYGIEYDLPENLDLLRRRALGRKRSLALREFALGVEALHRFVEREPLRRVHECVFGVLAMETEPVDPRL